LREQRKHQPKQRPRVGQYVSWGTHFAKVAIKDPEVDITTRGLRERMTTTTTSRSKSLKNQRGVTTNQGLSQV
jgi:hypothetical protein